MPILLFGLGVLALLLLIVIGVYFTRRSRAGGASLDPRKGPPEESIGEPGVPRHLH